MLASGAHVKIGDKEFRLDFTSEAAYSHSLNTTGEAVQFWLWDDWVGGEGNDAYDPLDEIVYHQGLVNPRVPGKLTTPPTRTSFSTAALSPAPDKALAAVANGRLWVVGEQVTNDVSSAWYTNNLTSWTEISNLGWSSTNTLDRITAFCSDGMNVYVLASEDSGDYQIVKVTPDDTKTTIRNFANGNVFLIRNMAVLGNYIYTWNGNKLRERKLTTAAANTGDSYDVTIPPDLGNDLTNMVWGTDYWTDMVSGEGAIYYHYATEGQTIVFEKQQSGAGGEMWRLPTGFTGKSLAYQSGALLIFGEYLNQAAAYGMSVISRQPLFLGFVRYGSTVSPEVAGAGFGTEVIFAEKDVGSGGKLFIYDIGYDAFSQMDEITHASGEIWAVGTWKDKRYAAVEDGNDFTIYAWEADDDQSTAVDGRWESGAWDMDLPEDEKQLDGIHVLSNAGTAGADYEVFYQDNEDGTWTSAGTATSGFHNYHQVSNASSTVTFRTLRLRIDPKDGCEIYAVSARYRVNTYEEGWELLLDLTDEQLDVERGRRRRTHEDRGHQLRDYIWDIVDNKTVVTFLDGARYPQGDGDDPDKYTTHTVVVDVPVDRLEKAGEGKMLVRLRSVAVN